MLFSYYSSIDLIKYIIYVTMFTAAVLSLLLFNDVFGLINLNIPTAGKLSATFGYKNFYAQYLCFAAPASFIGIFLVKNRKSKLFAFIAFLIILSALFITRTRSAWVAILLPIFIFIITYRKFIVNELKIFFSNKLYQIIAVGLSVLFIVIIFKPIDIKKGIWIGNKSSFIDTVLTIKDLNKQESWGYRFEMYKTSFEMIKDNPLFGVGLGNWKIMYPSYSTNKHITDEDPYKIILRPHNDLLWLIAEIGLIGFIACMFFMYKHFKILIKKLNNVVITNDKLIYHFVILSLSAIFIESMFDFPSERVMPNLFFWSMLGFISSGGYNKSYKKNIPISIFLLLIIAVVFSFFNLKAQYYAQTIGENIKDRDYNKVFNNTIKVKNNYRNANHLGIPIDYYQGVAFYKKYNNQKALAHFNKALDLYPYHLGSMDYLYKIYLNQRDVKLAKNIVRKISDKYPKIRKPKIDLFNYLSKTSENKEDTYFLDSLKNEIKIVKK